jgi:hypothetical protein
MFHAVTTYPAAAYRKRWRRLLAGFLFGWLALAPLRAARAAVVLRYDFAAGVAGWQTTFPGATLAPVSAAPGLPGGGSALEFAYTPNQSASPAFFTLPSTAAPGARMVRFWIRCTAATPIQFALGERDGSGYFYPVHCPANEWVYTAIPLADLVPAPATSDENRRFDPDQLGAIRFQDVSRYHARPGELTARRLLLAHLEFLTDTVASRHQARVVPGGRGLTVDDFDAAALAWEANTTVRAGAARIPGRRVARLAYSDSPPELPAEILTHIEGARVLNGLSRLRLVLRSARDIRLRVRLQEYLPEYRSISYEVTVPIPGSRDWKLVTIPIGAFRLAPGATDADGKLDPGKVWIIELEAPLAAPGSGENTLEIDEITAVYGR